MLKMSRANYFQYEEIGKFQLVQEKTEKDANTKMLGWSEKSLKGTAAKILWGEDGESVLDGDGVSIWKEEKRLEVDGGDGTQ